MLRPDILVKVAAVLAIALSMSCCLRGATSALVSGSTSLCQCTPRAITTSSYLDSLNSYTADMIRLLGEVTTQLASLGLKFSDFSSRVLASLLQITASTAEATKVANALLATVNSSSSSSSSGSSSSSSGTTPSCALQDSLAFFGGTVYQALGSGGSYSGTKWTVALSGGALTVDYGVKSCTSQTQYIQQICVDGYPSQVYIFIQATTTSSASLVADSLTVSSQSGAVCITIGQSVVAFSVLPRSLKSLYGLMPNYQFSLGVSGCFSAIPASCTPTIAPTTTIPCASGNALADVNILPVDFFYNVQVSRIDGTIINATAAGAAATTFLADLTADGCRAEPNVTQVCSAGNFKRMRIGRLVDYQGTILEFPGSQNVTATRNYQRFCYTINDKIAILAIQPAELFNPADTQFKFFPEARGCFDPVSNSCVARPPCVGPLEVGWHSVQLPQQSFTTTNMTYTGGQWVTTGTEGSLSVDFSAGGCRKSAAVTKVCVISTSASQVILNAVFQVGDSLFSTSNTLNGSTAPTPASPWCQTYSAAPTMQSLYISFPASASSPVNLRWTINGCFSTLPAYCLTTTAAPVTTVVTTTVRPPEICSVGFPTMTNSSTDVPASAISGGTFVPGSGTWTVAKGNSLTIDLTVGGCRQSARLLAVCILGTVATVRIDYVLEDNTRVIVPGSTTASQPAAGVPLCFELASVNAKSLVLQPTALKSASASDPAYSMLLNMSACYSAISSSCYSSICSCTTNYRPVFYTKKYYRISFKITSGYYSVYKTTYATPITADYQDLLNITDTIIWRNFGSYKDKYEGIDQVTFIAGSVDFAARLIMYDGGYTASDLETALRAGMASYTAGGTYLVSVPTVVISDATPNSEAASSDNTLLLAVLIPVLVLLILIIILAVLLCKYCKCCCFSKTDAVHAAVKTRMQEAGTGMSRTELIEPSPPPSARGDAYQYYEGGKDQKKVGDGDLPMPQHQRLQQQQEEQESEEERRRGQQRTQDIRRDRDPARQKRSKRKSRSAVSPQPAPGAATGEGYDSADAAATDAELGGIMAGAQPFQFNRQEPLEPRPNTPKTVSIETFTYQLRTTAPNE